LTFGTGTFGGKGDFFKAWGDTDAKGAERLIDICLDAGVNLVDTADIYSTGASEEIIGEALEGRRDRVLLATKARFPMGAGPNDAQHADDLSKVGADLGPPPSAVDDWDGDLFRERIPGPHFDASLAGTVLHSSADVVSSAPELARLTLNIAAVHHDSRIGGRRLVYGGHTIGLALAQASKLLPNLATVLGWQSCDHTGPVFEGDTLYSELHIESAEQTDGGGILGLRSVVYAFSDNPDEPRQVLDWRFTALQF